MSRGVSATLVDAPVAVAILVLWITVGVLLWLSLRRTEGHFVYALDDPYIHMAMAKNVALHGVWGVTADAFSSSSSSLIWTALLAAMFALLGVRDLIPFFLNIVLATVMVVVANRVLLRAVPLLSRAQRLMLLLVLLLAAPLPALVFAGQEHILHMIATVIFVFAAAEWIGRHDASMRSTEFQRLAALAMLLPLVRYEGLYPVATCSALLMVRRRIAQAAVLTIAALIPLAIYAAISLQNGWLWAPNSVVLKGNLPDWHTLDGIRNLLGYTAYATLLQVPAIAFLVYAAVALFAMRAAAGIWCPVVVRLVMFVGIAVMHAQYSQPRAFWLFRYEAYVIALGLMVSATALLGNTPSLRQRARWERAAVTIAVIVLLLISPLTDRAIRAAAIVPGATANIYEQQYQMGLFLREYYQAEPVALNDIGAAAYLADVRVLDLVGLATMQVAALKRAGYYTSADIEGLASDHGARVAIVYDNWFRGSLPSSWRRAGSWRIRRAVVVGDETVTFYAIVPSEWPALRDHLAEFDARLPRRVRRLPPSP
jgi:hypothetical protein